MFIASSSSVVKFHDFHTKQLVHTYQPTHKIDGPCRSLSWTKDGSWLAVVPHSGFTEIVTLKGHCKLLHTVQDISEPSCASFQNLTKRHIAVGTKHGQVLLYDIKSRSVKARYPRTSSAITHVGFTAKDTHCYAGCVSGDVLLFNNVAKTLSCALKVPKSRSLTCVSAHLIKRNFLIGGSNEGIVCVWDVNLNKIKFQTEAHSGPVTSAIFSPVNTALVVSAGTDRVVRVFDIDNQSRITSVPVENNIMSLDFLEDSLYIVMGAQNGKIHIYDTRSLQDPVYSFEAHKTAVKHIAFQNSCDTLGNNSSLGSLVGEEALTRPSKSNEEVQASKKRTSDFFGLISEKPASVSETFDGELENRSCSVDGGDSFMNALGLADSNTMDSIKEDNKKEEIVCKPPSRKSVNAFTPNPSSRLLGPYDSTSQPTSTPKFPSQNFIGGVSPIIASSANQSMTPVTLPGVNVSQLQTALKDDLIKEVKKAMEDMETKISYKFMDHAHLIRRMILDVQMTCFREFIKIEDYFNIVRDELNGSEQPTNRDSNFLMQENMNLRNRIQELESQIASLTAGDENSNDQ